MTRFNPAAPVLTIGAIAFRSIALSWTDISARGVPIVGYQVWRGDGTTPQSFTLIGTTAQGVLTYSDTTVLQETTYTYYVVGKYDSNRFTSWSNYQAGTTPRLEHLYGYEAGHIYVWNVKDVTTPYVEADVTVSGAIGPGSEARNLLVDLDYLYLRSSDYFYGSVRIFSLANPILPVLVATLPISNTGGPVGLLVRRGKTTYNNLLFTTDADKSTILCFNITDPANPVLKSSRASGMALVNETEFSFDETRGRLFFASDTSGGKSYGFLSVASDGTLSAGSTYSYMPDYYYSNGGFIYADRYWIYILGVGRWNGYPCGTLGAFTSWFGIGNVNGTHRGRLIGSKIYTFGGTKDASFSGLVVTDLTSLASPVTDVLVVSPINTRYNSLVVSGNYMYAIRDDGYMLIWDKSSMSIPGAVQPTLVSTTAMPAITYTGMLSGYISDDWDGNNGLCNR